MEVQKIDSSLMYLVFLGILGGLLLASSVIFMYMRYQKRFLQQQAARQLTELEHRKQLMYATIQSQENERLRISRDLHDQVGSSLSNLRFMVARIRLSEADAVVALTDECKGRIDNIISEIRNISHSLSPAGLELWGFIESLGSFTSQISASSGLEIKLVDNSADRLKKLPFDDSLSLFRVIQELVTNTIKHADAQKVTINISQENGDVLLEYKDDGKGMAATNENSRGIGFYNMESRLDMIGATYKTATAPGNGFTFTITLPAAQLNKEPV